VLAFYRNLLNLRLLLKNQKIKVILCFQIVRHIRTEDAKTYRPMREILSGKV